MAYAIVYVITYLQLLSFYQYCYSFLYIGVISMILILIQIISNIIQHIFD